MAKGWPPARPNSAVGEDDSSSPGSNPARMRRLDRSGLADTLGVENIVMATDVVFEAVDLAYEEGCRWLAADS